MTLITGKNVAVALIAGLLFLTTVENHAGEIESNLDKAIRAQVFAELKDNVQRLYEGDWLIVAAEGDKNANGRTTWTRYPVANRAHGVTGQYPGGLGLFN